MSATLKSEQLRQSIREGYLRHEYVRTYEVNSSSIFTALNDVDVPNIGSQLIVSGVRTWCVEKIPRRQNDTTARSQIFVDCVFTNDSQSYERTVNGLPTSNPADIVPLIQESWEEIEEPVKLAYLVSIMDQDGNVQSLPPYMGVRTYDADGAETNVPTYSGPIVNSSLEPRTDITRRARRKTITYWTWHRDWDDGWELFNDTTNSDTVTMTQYDEDGIRSQSTYAAGQLLISGFIREEHWRDAKLWFRRGIVMHKAPTGYGWDHIEPDVGTREVIFGQQYKTEIHETTPQQWTFTEIERFFGDENAQRWTPIVLPPAPGSIVSTPVPVTEPVKLNGYGRELRYHRPPAGAARTLDGSYRLRFRIYPYRAFSTLGIA